MICFSFHIKCTVQLLMTSSTLLGMLFVYDSNNIFLFDFNNRVPYFFGESKLPINVPVLFFEDVNYFVFRYYGWFYACFVEFICISFK